jgi:hypothetical protein
LKSSSLQLNAGDLLHGLQLPALESGQAKK